MKKVRKVFMIFTIAFMLCGCYKANINIEVNSNGTADMSVEMLMLESSLKSMGYSMDDLKESVLNSMNDETKDKFIIKDIYKTLDDEEYVGFEMIYDNGEIDATLFKKIIKISNDTITFSLNKEQIGSLISPAISDSNNTMEGIEFNFNVTMPGKILENNIGEVDGKTVKINLLTLKETYITIKSELGGVDNTTIIVSVVGGIVVIMAVAFYLLKKKKNKDNDNIDNSDSTETVVESVEDIEEENNTSSATEDNTTVEQSTEN